MGLKSKQNIDTEGNKMDSILKAIQQMLRIFKMKDVVAESPFKNKSDIAERLCMKEATVKRDIKLLNTLGFHLYSSKGFWVVEKVTGNENLEARNKLLKIKKDVSELEKLLNQRLGEEDFLSYSFEKTDSTVHKKFHELCEFAAEGKVVSFFYSAVGAFPKRVVVLPRLIAERNNRFYCIAYRFDKERYITYSIDRVDSYEIQAEEDQNKYQKQIEALIPFDKDSWFKQIVGISNEDAEIMEVELLFTPWQAQYMRMYKFHPEEQVLFDDRNEDGMENGKGRCIRVTLKNTYELRAKILELGKGVEVLKPQKLRDQIQNMLLEILEKYKS